MSVNSETWKKYENIIFEILKLMDQILRMISINKSFILRMLYNLSQVYALETAEYEKFEIYSSILLASIEEYQSTADKKLSSHIYY